jgi:two-component system, LytTR family, response regulator
MMHSAYQRRLVRTLIVDDEPLARRNLSVLLRQDPEIGPVDECGSGFEAIAAIRTTRPALVFLDVQMPECDGFDVIEMLGSDVPPAVIFVTAHDEYALRAFDVGALDYLLKPFDDARFRRALARAKDKLTDKEQRLPPTRRLVIKSAGQVLFVSASEIDWIEAADYYACLHVGNQTHLLRRSLADLERDLASDKFCRIHRSVIVNLDRVKGLELKDDGEYEVVLKTNSRLRLSRRFRKLLEDRLGILPPTL